MISFPSTQTPPLLGDSNPAISRKSVDLPDPDGPSTITNSPASMVRSIACRALVPPGNDFASRRSSICAKASPTSHEANAVSSMIGHVHRRC